FPRTSYCLIGTKWQFCCQSISQLNNHHMKNIFIVLLLISSYSFAYTPYQKTTLSGKVTDKQTGTTLPGVTIFIPDLKTGGVTGIDGTYKLENLPSSKMLFQISFIGYKTIIETIDLSVTTTKDLVLEPSVKEINEIVVTGHQA